MVYFNKEEKQVLKDNVLKRIIKSYEKGYKGKNPLSTTNLNKKIGVSTSLFEDSKEIFPWRYKAAEEKTRKLYNWYKNKNKNDSNKKTKIKKIEIDFKDKNNIINDKIYYYPNFPYYFRLIKIKLRFKEKIEEIEG